jgi:GTPase SAR1 family protein
MGVGESSVPSGSGRHQPKDIEIAGEIVVSVHGQRKMGKTTLLNRMRNLPVSDHYVPTPKSEAVEYFWRLSSGMANLIKITVWEIVPKNKESGISQPAADEEHRIPPADGIVVLYDPSDEESWAYAEGIIQSSPSILPILVLANFLDKRRNTYLTCNSLDAFGTRVVQVQTSLLSMSGLSVVAKWLDFPWFYNRTKVYRSLVEGSRVEMRMAQAELKEEISEFDSTLKESVVRDEMEKWEEVPVEFRVGGDGDEFESERPMAADFCVRLDYEGN